MAKTTFSLAAAAAVLVALAVPALSGCGSRNAVAAGVAVGAPAEKLANTYRKRLPIDLDESHRVIDVLSSTKNDSVTFTFVVQTTDKNADPVKFQEAFRTNPCHNRTSMNILSFSDTLESRLVTEDSKEIARASVTKKYCNTFER